MTQDEALKVLKTGVNVFLTGEPGSGKTHTVNRYIGWLKEHAIEPAVTASTGIAATHIGGYTIHSWSGIGIKNTLSKDDLERLGRNNRLASRARKTHVLIIDEISMLSAATLSLVDAACRALRKNTAPFGGMQVVLVGDFFQLPPVVRQDEQKMAERELFSGGEDPRKLFSFSSPSWRVLNPVVCYLSEQYRQDDVVFLDVLSAIRRESVSEVHRTTLLSRRARTADTEHTTQLYTHNIDVDRVNVEKLARISKKPRMFTMERHGPAKLTDQLVRGCLSPEMLTLKEGARVMFTKNNFQAGFVNGTTGVVTGFAERDAGGYPIVKTTRGRHILAEPMDWRIEGDGTVLARIMQIPLRLAWAITVHKSQGMSLDAAHVDLRAAFEYGQGYVALSRVRALSGLTLAGLNDRALRVHPDIAKEDRIFRAASSAAQKVYAQLSPGELTERENAFIAQCGGKKPKEKTPSAQKQHTKAFSLEDIRKKHPNAYTPWSKEEEKKVTDWFSAGESAARIARALGRQPGAIRARLLKLGMIQD